MKKTTPVLLVLAGLGGWSCSQGARTAAVAPAGAVQAAGQATAGSPSDVVGEVSGVKITLAEVDKKAAGRLARVREEEYEARKLALEELVADKLAEKEAAARGISTEALLKAEIDVYWIQAGGGDPCEWIRRCAGREPLLHLKDMAVGPD